MAILIEKIKKIFTENEARIVLCAGLILIAAVAFESGYLKGKTAGNNPIVIEKTISGQNLRPETAQGVPVGAQNSLQEPQASLAGSITLSKNCAFVGSKNSDKYHLPTSRCAKQIKPENLVCFVSVEDAKAKNYQEGCLK